MKCAFLFLFGTFFGFFDVVTFLVFLVFFMVLMFLEGAFFGFSGVLFCDGLSFFLVYLTVLVLIFCLFSSLIEMWGCNYFSTFFSLMFFIFFFLFVSFTTFSVFIFYMCFEAIFMLMYLFVLSWGYSPERVQASFYMVFYTIVVSFPFLVFMISFEENVFSLKFMFFYEFSSYWWLFLFLVFLVKLPVYGVHLWLPKAHVEAPISGSMVLAGVLLKLGGYGFLRFSFFSSFSLFNFSGYFLSIGLVGGTISCFLCLRQVDLKSFVAYSSICHMGFGLSGIYSYSVYGVAGGIYMLIAHGFCSSCMFYLLYVFYERFHTRSSFLLKGVGALMPLMLLSWFLFSVLNMGVPPSFSFFSEISILAGISSFNFFVVFFSASFLFLAGLYGIFFYVMVGHGGVLLSSGGFLVSTRELLNIYGHFFPLLFIPFYLSTFCF